MSSGTDKYREWDGAYVMGALAPHERREYEQHCASCPDCSRDLGQLAGITGILATVPPERAISLLGDDASSAEDAGERSEARSAWAEHDRVPPTLLPRVVTAARRARTRNRLRAGGLLLAAAAAAVTVVWSTGLLDRDEVQLVVLEQTVPSPVSAEARLVEEEWGTTIEVTCWYEDDGSTPAPGDPQPPFEYSLSITDETGATTEYATWMAGPGSVTTPAATTRLAVDEIERIDIRWVPGDVVILEARP
jgi:hypothetical protein